jgi:hypothetical protein
MKLGVRENSVWRWENGKVAVPKLVSLAMRAVVIDEGGSKKPRS